jgi:hypothetical protein
MGSGMARSLKYPALALAFAVVLVCYSVWDLLGQLSGRRYSLGVAPSAGAAPEKFIAWVTGKEYIELVASKDGWANVPPTQGSSPCCSDTQRQGG